MFKKLWNDETGAVLSAEVVCLTTILVLGLTSGLATLRNALIKEMGSFADAISASDKSFSTTAPIPRGVVTPVSRFANQAAGQVTGHHVAVSNSTCVVIGRGEVAATSLAGSGGA